MTSIPAFTYGYNDDGSRSSLTLSNQSSMAQRLDLNGNVLGSYSFDAYGTRASTDNSSDPYTGFGAQWGYYRDAETGLSLLGHQYYDPSQGRFLNRDPIGYGGGLNLYAYVGSNPLTRTDPTGFQFPSEEQAMEAVEKCPHNLTRIRSNQRGHGGCL